MNKYIAFLIGSTAIFFSVMSYAFEKRYSGGHDRYEPSNFRWICNPYDQCRKVYYPRSRHASSYEYDRYLGRKLWRKKNKNSEPKHDYVTPPEKIEDSNIINVNLAHGTWAAYDSDGNLLNSGHVSGGKKFCPDINKKCKTITGTFSIYYKKGADCKSKIFPVGKGGAPMPYCMFFHEGYALHGSNAVPNYNASHGCVRMKPSDAKWLNQKFVEEGKTRVNITYEKITPKEKEEVLSETDTGDRV